MAYEIDYLAVGDGEKSADAICLRYGNLIGPREEQFVITIDGGTLESGKQIVEHIKKYYGTDLVDVAILTHADIDHASGMRQILEDLRVKQVVMHLPWNHSSDIKALLNDTDTTISALKAKTKRNLSAAHEIEEIALRKKIPIVEPFSGMKSSNGVLTILGPTKEFYQEMLSSFKFMPEAAILSRSFSTILSEAVKWLRENWLTESLQEPAVDATSPENNSSLIFVLEINGRKILFAGDAGVPALNGAVAYANANQISLSGITFFHVPHHGGRHNLGPTILNQLFGTIRRTDMPHWEAVVSAAKGGAPKHPHKKVTNALRRRGASVYVTAGQHIRFHHDAPPRPDWSLTINPLPFYDQVEDDDS